MSIDIVFSFDTTGSQYPILTELRRRVQETIKNLFEIPDLRIGLIAHGDYNDSPYAIKVLELTTDQSALINFVQTAEQTNGFGNGGEQYEAVMNTARKFNWQSDTRAFVMLGDEPAHNRGPYYPDYMYPFRSRLGVNRVTLDWQIEAQALQDMGIHSYMVRCQNRSDSRNFHTTVSRIWDTPLLHLHQFSDIEKLIFALTYKQQSNERLEQYSTELETIGGLNRSMTMIIDQLLGRATNTVDTTYNRIENNPYPQRTRFTIPDGLVPVEPTRFQMLHVDRDTPIKDFVQSTGARFQTGKGFYELTKTEEVQESKEVIARDKVSGDMFTGKDARDLIGIPLGTRGKAKPNRNSRYDIFIQSTSNNRKLMGNTRFLYEAEMY